MVPDEARVNIVVPDVGPVEPRHALHGVHAPVQRDGVPQAGDERARGQRGQVERAHLVPRAEHQKRTAARRALARPPVARQPVARVARALVPRLVRRAALRAHAPRSARVLAPARRTVALQV